MISSKPSVVAEEHNLTLPEGYRVTLRLNLTNLQPWHFLTDEEFEFLITGINKRYPQRFVIPFARKVDSDDVGCFIVHDSDQNTGEIAVIHDFASSGYEVVKRIKSYWEWFRFAVDEMIEWQKSGE